MTSEDIILRALGYAGPTDMQSVTADDAFRAMESLPRGDLTGIEVYRGRGDDILAAVEFADGPDYVGAGRTLTAALIAAAAKAIEAESKHA